MEHKTIAKKNNWTAWVTCYIMLLLSGTAVGSVFSIQLMAGCLAVIAGISVYSWNKYVDKRNLVTFVFLSILNLFNYSVFTLTSNQPSLGPYIWYQFVLLFSFFMVSTYDRDTILRIMVVLTVCIAVVSLILFWGAKNGLFYEKAIQVNQYHRMLGFHTYCGFTSDRNAAIFWEPGIFQIYLNFSIFMIAFGYFQGAQWRKLLYLIILIVAVLETKSTTGYVVLLLIGLYFLRVRWGSMNAVLKVLVFLPVIALAVSLVLMVFQTEAIQYKFFSSNSSLPIRLKSLIETPVIIAKHPLLGVGYGTRMQYAEQYLHGIDNNNNGLWNLGLYHGILYMGMYIVLLTKGVKAYFPKDYAVVLLLMFLFLSTEPLSDYAFFVMWIYKDCGVKRMGSSVLPIKNIHQNLP